MESVAVLAVVDGALGLIAKCCKSVQSLHDLTVKYKQAELVILSIVQELDTVQLAWEQISMRVDGRNECTTIDDELLQRISRSLKCGIIVMSALGQDLACYTKRVESLSSGQRFRTVWDCNTFKDHLDRLRGQALSMTLLLAVINLPEVSSRKKMLAKGAAILHSSDESAYSIVPSRTSYSSGYRNSQTSHESAELDGESFQSRQVVIRKSVQTEDEGTTDEQQHSRLTKHVRNTDRSKHGESAIPAPTNRKLRSKSIQGQKFSEIKIPVKSNFVGLESQPTTCNGTAHDECLYSADCLYKDGLDCTKKERKGTVELPANRSEENISTDESITNPSHKQSVGLSKLLSIFPELKDIKNDLPRQESAENNPIDTVVASSEQVSMDDTKIDKWEILINGSSPFIGWRVKSFRSPNMSGQSLASNTGRTFIISGPAVSCDLRQRDPGSRNCHSFSRSVDCCKEEDLKSLLMLHGSNFAEWRKHYFLEACRQGKAYLVQTLLESGETIDHEHDGVTGPQLAAIGGHVDVIERLLLWGFDNNIEVIEQYSLLHCAASSGKEALIHFLSTQGARIDFRDRNGVESIHLATLRGHLESIRCLLLAGACVDCLDPDGRQPLHYLGFPDSSDHSDTFEILHLLLVAGARIDFETTNGETPLDIAAQNRKINTLEALLHLGASLNPSRTRESPLLAACRRGSTGIVQILLRYGTIYDVCNVGGGRHSPLSVAISDQHGLIVQSLLRKAADLEIIGEETLEPLYRACEKHSLWVAPILKQKITSAKSLIVGDLLACGPLFSQRRNGSNIGKANGAILKTSLTVEGM